MLFWMYVENGILWDRPLLLKLHQSYRLLPRYIQEFNPVAQEMWSVPQFPQERLQPEGSASARIPNFSQLSYLKK